MDWLFLALIAMIVIYWLLSSRIWDYFCDKYFWEYKDKKDDSSDNR